MKIDKLTPEQEAMLPVYRDKWIAIGMSTERIDPTRATEAVKLLYACGGKGTRKDSVCKWPTSC